MSKTLNAFSFNKSISIISELNLFDGADSIMLSDETAIGSYPVLAVKVLKKVIKRTEDHIMKENFFDRK
jgi:pyruvate kinase